MSLNLDKITERVLLWLHRIDNFGPKVDVASWQLWGNEPGEANDQRKGGERGDFRLALRSLAVGRGKRRWDSPH